MLFGLLMSASRAPIAALIAPSAPETLAIEGAKVALMVRLAQAGARHIPTARG